MEQKVIPIILNGKDSAERMKEITDRLETGIQQLFDSDRYKAYLTTMAKFHNYSFNNTLLIAMQGGQLVAGFNKWKDTFHRTVKKGEKGIKILAPAPYKVKQKMEKLDEQGKPVLDKDGKPLTEEKTVQIPAFKVVSVFDVSQTANRCPLSPWMNCPAACRTTKIFSRHWSRLPRCQSGLRTSRAGRTATFICSTTALPSKRA